MSLDSSRELEESVLMDLDSGEPSRHSNRCGSVEMDFLGHPGAQTSFEFRSQSHELASSIHTPILELPSQVPAPSSSAGIDFWDMGDVHQSHGLASQRGATHPDSKSSVQDTEVASRKRKHSHGSPHTHITDCNDIAYDNALAGDANLQPRGRIRPRLRTRQDGEFSPLLIMSPSQDGDSPVEEETISMFHYPTNVTDTSYSIRRYFRTENPSEHGPRILQNSSFLQVDDLVDRQRSDSASSFAEVALASTASRTHGRLSTLSDIYVPRPFEDAERPSLGNIDLVHERGLDVLPAFFSTGIGGRMGNQWGSREPVGSQTGARGQPIRLPVPMLTAVHEHGAHAVSPRSTELPLESGTIKFFFDKPLCESPDSISPDEDGTLGARVDSITQGPSVYRRMGDST